MNEKPFKIAIAGLGTVGAGVIKIFEENYPILKNAAGREIEIIAVSARDRNLSRGVDLSSYNWEQNPIKLAELTDVDLIVETIGGEGDPAKSLIEKAFLMKKHVVTANKALIAHHGHDLALLAEEVGVSLRFEASVAGGIPIIKALSESLAANKISRVLGVINGTCNYILTEMENREESFSTVFSEAEKLGYVEKNPALDVGGIDSAHKLAILSSIAFGSRINFNGIAIEGIENVSLADIKNAKSMGYRIKLLGLGRMTDKGLSQEIRPCLVPKNSSFGQLEGGINMVMVDGNFVEQATFVGPGAGSGPTASAVVADIIDIAKGNKTYPFGRSTESLAIHKRAEEDVKSAYYLRFSIADKPGVLAQIANVLGYHNISINRMRQTGHDGEVAPLLIVTHDTERSGLELALSEIKMLDICLAAPIAIRIEEV